MGKELKNKNKTSYLSFAGIFEKLATNKLYKRIKNLTTYVDIQ